MSPNETTLWDAIDEIRRSDPRYRREAYVFVITSLGVTVQSLPKERLDDPLRRHLTGSELVRGMIAIAKDEFGALAPTVFREWGFHHSEDIGNVVFQLVRCGQLSARPEDSIDDFSGIDLLGSLAGAGDPFQGPTPDRRSAKRTGPELEA